MNTTQCAILDANYGRKDSKAEERVKQVFCEVGVDGYYDQYEAEAYARIYAQIDAILEVKSLCGEAVHHFWCCFHGKTKRNSTAPLGEQAAKWAVAA